MTYRLRIAALLLSTGVVLGACSSGSSDAATSTTSPPTTSVADNSATTVVEAAADSDTSDPDEFCATFADLGEQRGEDGGNESPDSATGWDERIAVVTHIAEVAPDEIQAEADAYVVMTEDRAELAAENGFVSVEELPDDAKADFIASHTDLQQQVNALIDYAKDTCDGF